MSSCALRVPRATPFTCDTVTPYILQKVSICRFCLIRTGHVHGIDKCAYERRSCQAISVVGAHSERYTHHRYRPEQGEQCAQRQPFERKEGKQRRSGLKHIIYSQDCEQEHSRELLSVSDGRQGALLAVLRSKSSSWGRIKSLYQSLRRRSCSPAYHQAEDVSCNTRVVMPISALEIQAFKSTRFVPVNGLRWAMHRVRAKI